MRLVTILLVPILLMGCASMKTSLDQYSGIDEKLIQRDIQSAITQIRGAKEKQYTAKDKALYYLDIGMLEFYDKQHIKSLEHLSKAENIISDNYTKSASKATTSLLLNDNALEYGGEDYEDIYINIFKSLNYLDDNKFDDAFVEIRKVNIKLNRLEDKYRKMANSYGTSPDAKGEFKAGTNKFYNDAFARYLSMLIYRAEGKYDDARIDLDFLKKAWVEHPDIYDFTMPDFDKILDSNKRTIPLSFMSFVGKSPVKVSNTLYIHTEENLIIIATTSELPEGDRNLDDFDTIVWPGVKKGYHFKFQLPKFKRRDSCVGQVKVTIDDNEQIVLDKLEDISNVAEATYKVKEPIIYLKTIIRSTAKGLFSAQRKKEMESELDNEILGFFARALTDAIVDATENADLRISRFFPGEALIGEIGVSGGTHNIKIEYFSKSGNLLFVDNIQDYKVRRNGLNLINSYYLN